MHRRIMISRLHLFILRTLLLLLPVVGVGTCMLYADEFSRLRYLVLSDENGTLLQGENKSDETLSTSGYSGYFVFENGFGFGFTTMTTKGSIGSDSHSEQSDNLDISLTFGGEWNLTLGYGQGIYGRGELSRNGTEYVTDKVRGGGGFLLLGIPLFGGELLAGYRMNELEFGTYQAKVNGTNSRLDDCVLVKSEHVMTGFGLHF